MVTMQNDACFLLYHLQYSANYEKYSANYEERTTVKNATFLATKRTTHFVMRYNSNV